MSMAVSGTKRPRHSALRPPRSGSQNSRTLASDRGHSIRHSRAGADCLAWGPTRISMFGKPMFEVGAGGKLRCFSQFIVSFIGPNPPSSDGEGFSRFFCSIDRLRKMGVPVNAHFTESVYELHNRKSHCFSPPLPHRLDHEVSLQSAGRRIARPDTDDYPASLQRTRRADRVRPAWVGHRLSLQVASGTVPVAFMRFSAVCYWPPNCPKTICIHSRTESLRSV